MGRWHAGQALRGMRLALPLLGMLRSCVLLLLFCSESSACAEKLPQMQAAEITLWCASGLRRQDVRVELSAAHDRCKSQRVCEDRVGSIWDARLAANPSLYNGAKFRLAGFAFPEEGGGGSSAPATLTILLGLTDYRDYLGTNLAPNWRDLLALDSACPARAGHGGRRMCVPGARGACGSCLECRCENRAHYQVVEADARSGTCLANTVGNAAMLHIDFVLLN